VDNAVLYRKNPTRRYELRPGVDAVVGRTPVRIRINAAGFRDDVDYSEEKPAGTFRAVVLGDSFTFAGKVALADTMAKRLEGWLRKDPSMRYEVLNLAVPGYNTDQEASILDDVGLRYAPDLVLVSFVLNDALPAGQLVPKAPRIPEPVRRVLKRSYLVQFLYDREKRLRSDWTKGSFKGASEVSDLRPDTPGFHRVETSLTRIRDLAANRHARLLVVIWPMLERLDSYPFGSEHALVVATCERLGIPALDLLPVFRGRDEKALWVAGSDHHPNAAAQRMAADAVFADLRARGLVTSRP
jgi:hypothetical protein